MTPEEIAALYDAAPEAGSGGTFEDRIGGLYDQAGEPWNAIDMAKQFGSGVVEGLAGTGALFRDILSPQERLSKLTESALGVRPKMSKMEVAFPASVETALATNALLPKQDPTYRYTRTAGQFMGPAAGPGVLAKAPVVALKAAVGEIPAAIGAQAAEDITGERIIAPLSGAVGAKALTSLFGGLFSAAKRGIAGATRDEITGSAAKAFKDQTGLTEAQIAQSLTGRANDPLLAYKTTAEVTDNAGAAQLEKTLSAADEPARLYNQRGMQREAARDAIIDQLAPARTSTREGFGSTLIAAADAQKEKMGKAARDLWETVPRWEPVEISGQMDEIARIVGSKQGGSRTGSEVRELVDQFLESPVQTSGRLQDIRHSALYQLREKKLGPHEQRLLDALQSGIDEAVAMSGNNRLYGKWKAARDATAARAETFKPGTAGGALTEEMARPSNVLANAIKGDKRSIQEIRRATGGDPDLMAQVSRGVLDSIPRDAQGRLTPAKMRSYLQSNEGALTELLGNQHYRSLGRVLEDLQSEARVSEMAFRSSKGGSVTSQRQTVAGAIEDVMLSASTKDMPGWIAKLLTQLKEGAGIRDKLAVRDLLFRAAMDPAFARDLAATPTQTRILTAFERLARIGSDAGIGALKSAGIEIGSSTDVSKERRAPKAKEGLSKSESPALRKLSDALVAPAEALELQPANRANTLPSTLFNPTGEANQEDSAKTLAFMGRLFGGSNAGIAALFGGNAGKKNGAEMELKYNDVIDRLKPALVQQESGGKADAVSPKGAMGLWQIMPETWKWFAPKVEGADPKKPYDPENNELVGRAYLNYLLTRFKGDVPLALAAYNHGEGNVERKVRKWGNSLKAIYPRLPLETQQYVKNILAKTELA